MESISQSDYKLVKYWDFSTMSRDVFGRSFNTRYIWDRDTDNGNGERQFYCDPNEHYDPFQLSPAGLDINARKRLPDENYTDKEYLSGVITTRGKEGGVIPSTTTATTRVSALLTMPVSNGVWPAWWFLPEFEQWPEELEGGVLPELDGMENIGHLHRYYTNIHSRGTGTVLNQDQYTHNCPDVPLDQPLWFHFERGPVYTRYGFQNGWSKIAFTPPDLQGPLHMLINLAIGGYWPESQTGRPMEERYQFKVHEVAMYERQDAQILDIPPLDGNPNRDLIRRLADIRMQQRQCVSTPIDQWISELI